MRAACKYCEFHRPLSRQCFLTQRPVEENDKCGFYSDKEDAVAEQIRQEKLAERRRIFSENFEKIMAKLFPMRFCPHCGRTLHLGEFRGDDNSLRDVCNDCHVQGIAAKKKRQKQWDY